MDAGHQVTLSDSSKSSTPAASYDPDCFSIRQVVPISWLGLKHRSPSASRTAFSVTSSPRNQEALEAPTGTDRGEVFQLSAASARGASVLDSRIWSPRRLSFRAGVATPEKALFDTVYLLIARTGRGSFPEIELPKQFNREALYSWVGRIASPRWRTLTSEYLAALGLPEHRGNV